MDWSFSGCGFLGVYHVGVASCLREYAPHLVNKIYGASGGALAGCCLICNCCLGEAITTLLTMVTKARSKSLGPLHPSFNISKILKAGLENVLPSNAHEIASGRLFISLTRITDSQNVMVSQFKSKDDLIQALLCSSFIPVYCGVIPPTYQGIRYLDGGITDNQPIFNERTITISPFAGETDICPLDSSNSFFSFEITNTNVQINMNNIYRLCCALFPPTAELLNDMCTQGFEDTLRFLQRRSLIACVRCLCLKTKKRKPKGSILEESNDKRRDSSPPSLLVPNDKSILTNGQRDVCCGLTNGTLSHTSSFRSPLTVRRLVDKKENSSSGSAVMRRASFSALFGSSRPCHVSRQPTAPITATNLNDLSVSKKHANGKCMECRVPLCSVDMRIFDITSFNNNAPHIHEPNNNNSNNVNNNNNAHALECRGVTSNVSPLPPPTSPAARLSPVSKTFNNQPNPYYHHQHAHRASAVDNNIKFTDIDYQQFKQLPPSVSEAFKAGCKKMDKGLLNFIMRLPPMKLLAYYVYICLFPMDLFMSILFRFFDWIPYLPGDLMWIFGHLVPLIRLFLKKLCESKTESKTSLTCEFAVIHENYYDDYKEVAKANYFDHYQLSSLNLDGPLL